jgi:excisionase family DNA binding protein
MPQWRKGDPHYISPNPNLLEGIPAIAHYLDKSYNTVLEWIETKGLPAMKTGRGRWTTSRQAIMAWILADLEHSPLKQDPLIEILLMRTISRVENSSLSTSSQDEEVPICPYTGRKLPSQLNRMDQPLVIGTGAIAIRT